MSYKCDKCKKRFRKYSPKCPYCAAPIKMNDDNRDEVITYNEASARSWKKSRPKRVLKIALAVLLAAAILCLVIFDPFLWFLKPMEVYYAAVGSAASNKSSNFTLSYDIDYSYFGTPIHDTKVTDYSVIYGDTLEACDMTMHTVSNVEGVTMDYRSYYDDGMLYSDINGEKSSEAADLSLILNQSSMLCPTYVLHNPNLSKEFTMRREGDVRILTADISVVAAKVLYYVDKYLSLFPQLYENLPYFEVDSYVHTFIVDADTYEIIEERLDFVLKLKYDGYRSDLNFAAVSRIKSVNDVVIQFPDGMHDW